MAVKKGVEAFKIEFSNNGLIDSVSGSPAPRIFIDNLVREVARSNRSHQAFSITTIKIANHLEITASNYGQFLENTILVNRALKANLRAGDFYSRFADTGFWICINGDLAEAEFAVARFESAINVVGGKSIDFEFSTQQWQHKEVALGFIERIDREFFKNSD
ncbi:MAG: hypothetical protein HQ476_01595 [SAR202 cluster bacterium]|nr:hypothetical protein [SAR202 cluster bacterium]